MSQSIETSERGPWTVQSVLSQLDRISALDGHDILRALAGEKEKIALALRDAVCVQNGRAKVSAAALLLLLNDENGRDPFLEALAGPDCEEREVAIGFVRHSIWPNDIETHGIITTTCPITSDELYTALKRNLQEPWTGLNRRILELVSWQDYPQARPITRPLLMHPDPLLRREIAEMYLRYGRDEGAFAVVDEILRSAPRHVPHGDPRWHDFYRVTGLWYDLEKAVERGDAELRTKVASLTMALVSEALDAPDVKQRFDFNEGLIRTGAADILAAILPTGAKQLLERMIDCNAIDEYFRGNALLAYARALGDDARSFVLSKLQILDLRKYAAEASEALVRDKNDPQDVAILSDAIAKEEQPNVVAAIAKALLAAGPVGRSAVEAALARSEPWTRMELSWRLAGGSDRELADVLTEAGVMDPISDEQLADALKSGFDIRSLIWAGGERLVTFNVKSTTGLEHFELFRELLQVARPKIAVDDLKETCDANLLREPVEGMPNVAKVTDFGTICTISFRYQGRDFSFQTYPQGRWHDVTAVMQGFDEFMQAIGRDERCYELEGGGEIAMLVVAPASKFEPVAARLAIPLERDSECARDAAKAYQRHVQNL